MKHKNSYFIKRRLRDKSFGVFSGRLASKAKKLFENRVTNVEPSKISSDIEKYKKEAKENYDKFLRSMAEFDNYRKRMMREQAKIIESANEKLLLEILPVIDNFIRALDSADKSKDYNSLYQGIKLIYNQLENIISKQGITPIESVGHQFDPTRHEAMMQQPSKEYPEGVIMMEFERGYLMGNRVIKPAKVVVSSGPA